MSQLSFQLSQFGLNPKNWKLIPLGENLFEIQNIEDADYKLLGKLKEADSATWEQIYLLSL